MDFFITFLPINNDQSKILSVNKPIIIIRFYEVLKRREEIWFQLDKNY